MRYIDLMGGQKPHLLIKTINNLGAETVVGPFHSAIGEFSGAGPTGVGGHRSPAGKAQRSEAPTRT